MLKMGDGRINWRQNSARYRYWLPTIDNSKYERKKNTFETFNNIIVNRLIEDVNPRIT